MNWAYLHVIINHFPIVGVIIGTLILIAGMVFKNEGIKMSGLGTLAFASIMAIIVDLTGDPAREAVRGLTDFVPSLISRHENIASAALYIMAPLGLLAAVTLYSIFNKARFVRFLLILTLILSLISCAAMGYVGHTGGQIRHSEFRNDATKQYMIDHQNDIEEDD